jgi:hypothetical protein
MSNFQQKICITIWLFEKFDGELAMRER